MKRYPYPPSTTTEAWSETAPCGSTACEKTILRIEVRATEAYLSSQRTDARTRVKEESASNTWGCPPASYLSSTRYPSEVRQRVVWPISLVSSSSRVFSRSGSDALSTSSKSFSSPRGASTLKGRKEGRNLSGSLSISNVTANVKSATL